MNNISVSDFNGIIIYYYCRYVARDRESRLSCVYIRLIFNAILYCLYYFLYEVTTYSRTSCIIAKIKATMAEAAGAEEATGQVVNAGVSGLKLGYEMGSDWNRGKNLMEVNDLNINLVRSKIITMQQLMETNQCSDIILLDTHLRTEMTIILMEFQSRLMVCENHLMEMTGPQKRFSPPRIMKPSGEKELLTQIHEEVRSIDNEYIKFCDDLESKKERQRRSSLASSVSETDFPTLDEVTNFQAKPCRQCIIVEWKDKNKNVKEYCIEVKRENATSYDWRFHCKAVEGRMEYSEKFVNNELPFASWSTYFVRVFAVNTAEIKGPSTTPVGVFMNQYPPDIKPSGLRVLCMAFHY